MVKLCQAVFLPLIMVN